MKRTALTAALVALSLTAVAHAGGAANPAALAERPAAFIAQPATKARLNALLGSANAGFLARNFQTVSTLQNSGNVVAVTGCRAHDCAANGSLVVYDVAHNTYKVWLKQNGKVRVFQDRSWVTPATLNQDVKTYIGNMLDW